MSLSARRAWIEIHRPSTSFTQYSVALRKESVDRNVQNRCNKVGLHASLSARRAWIEIVVTVFARLVNGSLSARRAWIEIAATRTAACGWIRRSPQGERG